MRWRRAVGGEVLSGRPGIYAQKTTEEVRGLHRLQRSAATWGKGLLLNALAVLPAIPAVRAWLGCPAEWWWSGANRSLVTFCAVECVAALLVLDAALTAIHVWWHGPLARLHAYGPHHRVPEAEIDWTTGQVWGAWEPLMGVPTVWVVILGLGIPLGPSLFATGVTLLMALWVHTPPRPWHRRIGWALVTPASHRVHHSFDPARYGLNCGFVFPWWDRIFRTHIDSLDFCY